MKLQRTLLAFGLLILGVIGLYPFIPLFLKTLFPPPTGEFAGKIFIDVLTQDATLMALKNSLIIGISVSFVGLIFSLPLAWLLTRTDLKGRSRWRTLFSLPYAIPSYIGGMAWIYLANPTTGLLNLAAGSSWINIYSYAGLILAMSCHYYTYIFLGLLQAFDRLDPSLEEAARISGAKDFVVFRQITLPLVFPSIISGMLLVFLAATACFGLPAVIGTPARIYLMTTRIYTFQRLGSMNAIQYAGALSLLLLVFAILVLVINHYILQGRAFKTLGGKTARPSLMCLGKKNFFAQSLLAVIYLVIFVLPLFAIGLAAFSDVPGILSWANLGLSNVRNIFFSTEETPRALFNSFYLASIAATIATAIGLLLGFLRHKTKLKGRSLVDIFASLPYATPGTVLAFAMIMAFGHTIFGLPFSLGNTLTLIAIAYIAKFMNFAVRTSGDGLSQIDDVLAEAARVSGASWGRTLIAIWLPLLAPALMASWFLIFMPSFSELTMTILLNGPGLETVGTLIFQLQQYADGGGGAAVLAFFTILLILFMNTMIKVISRGKYGL